MYNIYNYYMLITYKKKILCADVQYDHKLIIIIYECILITQLKLLKSKYKNANY